MNADHETQLRLLDLQAADTALAQLAHRRRTLPELAAIAERVKTKARLHDAVVDARTRLQDIAGEQRRMENDVETVRNRAVRDEARLQAGGLPARELASLQHEIASLARRQSTLEDELLDVMERAEEAAADLRRASAEQDAVDAEIAELEAKRDAAFAEIDAAAGQRTPQRAAVTGQLPADLLALYERGRAQTGTGAAMLRQRSCEACHIELSGSELGTVRDAPPDAVLRCENCRAILVRTAESGL
ncbi:zinc ribbon domain-containing protein [uncultured Jatrophihabitans sp.]|uniref:zinc ribbon domain-containing protein n=1 Tax=uncultured Jatrophihabitans sp. TaxID=1610747 RepID=UPI0035CA34C4